MEAIVFGNERIRKVDEEAETKDAGNDHSFSWWRIFQELLKMSINGPFVREWEKKIGKTDLPWREGW